MASFTRLVLLAILACAHAQYDEDRSPRYIASASEKVAPTPVPILKQINKHNEDGSYTYGYEAADGSFKIETKEANGEVKGKYGYKDDTGKLRVVEYGANKYGFQPAGEGITVAPPTLVDESNTEQPQRPSKGQARPQYRAPAPQSIDYDYEDATPAPRPPRPQYRAPVQQFKPAAAPTPPRPIFVAGAAPAPAQPEQDNFFSPAPQKRPKARPQQPAIEYAQQYEPQNFAPAQNYRQPQNFAPSQNFAPAQNYNQPRSQPNQIPNHQFSMLDQLLKEYSLPSNGAAPLHDITFGSY